MWSAFTHFTIMRLYAAVHFTETNHTEAIPLSLGLIAGNKLTERHINWTKQKMKVNLAAQTLRSSVADS